MSRDSVVATGSEDVLPELVALSVRPTVSALVDWDQKLGGPFKEPEKIGFNCSHDFSFCPTSRRWAINERSGLR